MSDTRWADVDRYATKLLVTPAGTLQAAIESADAAGRSRWLYRESCLSSLRTTSCGTAPSS